MGIFMSSWLSTPVQSFHQTASIPLSVSEKKEPFNSFKYVVFFESLGGGPVVAAAYRLYYILFFPVYLCLPWTTHNEHLRSRWLTMKSYKLNCHDLVYGVISVSCWLWLRISQGSKILPSLEIDKSILESVVATWRVRLADWWRIGCRWDYVSTLISSHEVWIEPAALSHWKKPSFPRIIAGCLLNKSLWRCSWHVQLGGPRTCWKGWNIPPGLGYGI